MINSNKRKQMLCAWAKANHKELYDNPLRLQKFLLFYELFSKVDGEYYDLSNLKGWRKGPVFSAVWGDYTREKELYEATITGTIIASKQAVNESRAKKSWFLCSILTEEELSDLTHHLNIWKKHEKEISAGEYNVPLDEKDLTDDDMKFVKELEDMYPESYIDSVYIIHIHDKYFLIKKDNMQFLTDKHYRVLEEMSEDNELDNPVYLGVEKETGRMIID